MTGFAFPEILVDIYRRFAGGDRDGATEVFYRYVPLIRFENQPRINLALRKHIYHRRGAIASPRVRAPFTAGRPGDARRPARPHDAARAGVAAALTQKSGDLDDLIDHQIFIQMMI